MLDRGAGVEREPRVAAGLADDPEQPVRVRVGLDVDGDGVGVRGEQRDHLAGSRDHQVHFHEGPGGVRHPGEGARPVGSDGEVVDEGAVHDVHVEGARPRAGERGDLVAERQHVGRHDRRQHHRVAGERQAHGRNRATKKPSVPWRCGNVRSAPGTRGCARPGKASPRSSIVAPDARTTSSFSAAISVHVE